MQSLTCSISQDHRVLAKHDVITCAGGETLLTAAAFDAICDDLLTNVERREIYLAGRNLHYYSFLPG